MAMHDPQYLRLARALCDKYQVHLIADEIMTGFGRTGTLFAHEQAGIVPDFMCLSKGLTGGYLPLSLVLAGEHIFQAFYDDSLARGFLHSHSYSGNPLACRAAIATLDIFDQDNVLAANRAKAAHMTACARVLAAHPKVKAFRNTGMIWAFEVEAGEADFAQRFAAAAQERELLLRPLGNTVYFMPPYVISADECELLVARTLEVLNAI
jgi:adenosylmethionine-8-amino-7-oxononanoate aminotransferase